MSAEPAPAPAIARGGPRPDMDGGVEALHNVIAPLDVAAAQQRAGLDE